MPKVISTIKFIASMLVLSLSCSSLMAAEQANKAIPASSQAVSSVKPKIIIMLGAPGSGKGTQSVKLAKELHIPHISTGDILRENVKNETALGKEAKSFMDAGKLVPDELVSKLLYARLAQADAVKGYILDGFPRTVSQAKELSEHLKDKVQILAVYLKVTDDIVIKRILARAKESKFARTDDTAEVIKERLKVYYEQTEPVIEYYKKENQLITVDGDAKQEDTFNTILSLYRKGENK